MLMAMTTDGFAGLSGSGEHFLKRGSSTILRTDHLKGVH